MNCEYFAVLLSGHLDGMNTPKEEDALQKHLENCEHCRLLLEQMQKNDKCLASQEIPFPSDLTEKIMAEVRKTKRSKKPFYISLAASGLAAAAVLALAFSGKVSTPVAEPSQATEAASVQLELKQPIRKIESFEPAELSEAAYEDSLAEGAEEDVPFYAAEDVPYYAAAADATQAGEEFAGIPARGTLSATAVLVVKATATELNCHHEEIALTELLEHLRKSEYELTGKEAAAYAVTWQDLQQLAREYEGCFDMEKYYDEDATYLNAIVIFAE